MKRFILFLFVLYMYSPATAQETWTMPIDSMKKALTQVDDDEVRLRLLRNLFARYAWSSPDSASPYALEYMLLAQKKKSDVYLVTAYDNYAILAQLTGNYPQALEYGFKSLSIAERTKNFLTICSSFNSLSDAYLAQGDIERAIFYAQKSTSVISTNYSLPAEQPTRENDTLNYFASSAYTLCKAYVKSSQPDSVLKYIRLVEWIWGYQWKDTGIRWPTIPFTYGSIEYQKGNYHKANRYYQEGIVAAQYRSLNKDLMDNLIGVAQSYKMLNQWDSTMYYAGEVLKVSETAQYPIVKMEALLLLANAFKVKNNIDSSAKYFELTLVTKDSLFNQSKIVQMQNSTFNEQLRQQEMEEADMLRLNRYRLYAFTAGIGILIVIVVFLYRNIRIKQKAKEQIQKAYSELKSTQAQLIQSEKMASLGELTAGIAHEIQNPLNFVNNFSELSNELMEEMKEELAEGSKQFAAGSRQSGEERLKLAEEIANDIKQNLEKINHHGKRAADIVKGMLLHSRTSSGQKEPTDINALADEYLRLSYHGMRAKDKSFNADFKTVLDPTLPKINVIPQDIGRVLLNLINNAFYAVDSRAKSIDPLTPKGGTKNDQNEYRPTVTISTASSKSPLGDSRLNDAVGQVGVKISVKDNGEGIPAHIVDKIFQPFFTTKPTGQGTGLGLSLSYDIVKAHGGELKVETKEGEGSVFIIQLPV